MSLLGKSIIIWGKDGTGKSRWLEENCIGNNFVGLDWHGDFQSKGLPGIYFNPVDINDMIEWLTRRDQYNKLIIKDIFIGWEEAENYFGSDGKNPLNIDRTKINWILSAKGPHHNNLCPIFIYHSPLQLPANVQTFWDYAVIFESEASDRDVKSRFNGSKLYDGYLMHKEMYNDDSEKIQKKDGSLIKPPLIISRTKPLPKISEAA